jgi:tryptophan synthase alpha chain
MSRIAKKFRELRKDNKKAFIAYITAGYPSLSVTGALVEALSDAGSDIIELGVPFSDPMADGPIIQEASQAALTKGVNLGQILTLVKRLRRRINTPLCLMTYFNPVFRFGLQRFIKTACESGVDGVIIPDLPPEEATGFMRLAETSGLDTILFISPTTSPRRMRMIARASRGFIYYVSLTGTTGMRRSVAADARGNIARIKRLTRKPVCVGFGISNARQVGQMQRLADGVIVGSAIMKKIRDSAGSPNLVRSVANFVAGLQSPKRR